MFRAGLLSLVCGLAAGGAIYGLVLLCDRVGSPYSDGHPDNALRTEYERFDVTPDGKPICPRCGKSDKVLTYQYGLTREAPPKGMVSAGCVVGPKSPEYHCGHCDARFGITPIAKQAFQR